jgi:glycosyltransferase involved in cell wall biosynthesis
VKARAVSYGFLSSSPPTPCGIATFTTALGSALARRGAAVHLVRVLDDREPFSSSQFAVTAELVATDPTSIEEAAEALNRCDVAFIQHEYGLYGGHDGSDVVRVLESLHVPSVAILHTVLPSPTRHQLEVLNDVIRHVDSVVVMTAAAESTLRQVNVVGATPVQVIPHGAAVAPFTARASATTRPVILTWGLIGPGKGIEWMIDAMVSLKDLDPAPRYVIAGRTHPKVLAHAGDVYRRSLERRVRDNDVSHMVTFDNNYRDMSSLNAMIAGADVVVLPYDSCDQATSGVLVDAVAAGRPVIATCFPHSRELLESGAGIVVPHRNPRALSDSLRRLFTEPDLATAMADEAQRIAPSLSWDGVAERYLSLADQIPVRVGAGA